MSGDLLQAGNSHYPPFRALGPSRRRCLLPTPSGVPGVFTSSGKQLCQSSTCSLVTVYPWPSSLLDSTIEMRHWFQILLFL